MPPRGLLGSADGLSSNLFLHESVGDWTSKWGSPTGGSVFITSLGPAASRPERSMNIYQYLLAPKEVSQKSSLHYKARTLQIYGTHSGSL